MMIPPPTPVGYHQRLFLRHMPLLNLPGLTSMMGMFEWMVWAVPCKTQSVTEAVSECSLSFLIILLCEFGQQQAEGLHEWCEKTAHEHLFPVSRALAIHNQNTGSLEHEQLIIAAQERRETILLEVWETYA